MLFSYGSIAHFLVKPGERPVWLALAWIGLLLAAEAWMIMRQRGSPKGMTRVLNIAGAAALASCLWGFAGYGLHVARANAVFTTATPLPATPTPVPVILAPSPPPAPPDDTPPDIYYIILDGHARSDVLSEIYGVNNQPFIDFLRSKGFNVAAQSHSNYDQTALSLSSSLNFNYLDALAELDPTSNDRTPMNYLINNSAAAQFLKARGYHTVAFTNGFPETEMSGADQFIHDPEALNGFEISLLADTPGGTALSPAMVDNYRQRILWEESELEKQVTEPGPKLVFAHFILPHPPFVFRQDGAPVTLDSADGSQYSGSRADYQAGYRDEVQYADTLAEQMISAILEHSARPPVILLQADHGPGLYLDRNSAANTCMRERFSILNAYYLPKQYNRPGKNAAGMLYPSISPVNSFRVVFDAYFGAGLPLLPDRSFFSLWATPYDFEEVTGKWGNTCPAG
jgi:Sulfatase